MLANQELKFFSSTISDTVGGLSVEQIVEWIGKMKNSIHCSVEQIPLSEMRQWKLDQHGDRLVHNSGKFFSIDGVRVETNFGLKKNWEQPIINQPEIGFLGILTQMRNGILHFLLQAKIEPGNINIVQLSPTLQATKSNYTRVHKGVSPLFLDYFNGEKNVHILIDQLQSEQGARFLKKRNRNIIIEVSKEDEIEIPGNFIWMTLKQIKELLNYDNLVNMDTRTVISSINCGLFKVDKELHLEMKNCMTSVSSSKYFEYLFSLLNADKSLFTIDEIISWITNLKSKYELNVEKINLLKVKDWDYDGNVISHVQGKYFSVIGNRVMIENREMYSWDQPMIKPVQEGLIGFILKKIDGVFHFLVQAKVETGNFDILEIAPTVQCLTGNYHINASEYDVPFVNYFLDVSNNNIIHKSLQSEEGGRFFKEQNLNIIIEVDDSFSTRVPSNYFWMTYSQLLVFMKFNNYLNIATRSLISLIPFNPHQP